MGLRRAPGDRYEVDHNVRMGAADVIRNRDARSDGGESPAVADAAPAAGPALCGPAFHGPAIR